MPNQSGDCSNGVHYSSLPSFVLRNRESYSLWKFKMSNYLMHEDLWESIDGYSAGDSTPDPVKVRKDRKALNKICLTLEGSAVTHVRMAKTAAEAWKALQNAFEYRGMSRRLSLERKLYRLSLENFDDIEAYINAVLSTAQDLADIGKIIEDVSLAAILLGGLTSKYESLVMALENSHVDITTELVKAKLLNEMSKQIDMNPVPATAMRSKDEPSYESKDKKIVCYRCGEPGHKSPGCPLRNKKNIKKKKPASKESTSLSALGTSNEYNMDKWYVDSGATKHMTSRRDWFVNINPIDLKVTVANGTKINAEGIGKIAINTDTSVKALNDVIYVPNLQTNLLSVKQAVEKGFTVMFDKTGCKFFDSKNFSFAGDPILYGSSCGGLYTLNCTVNTPQVRAYDVHSDSISRYQVWHKRLGHLCRIGMDLLKCSHDVIDYKEVEKSPCVPCVQAKQARKPFKKIIYKRGTSILELIHSDICGPMSVSSFQGNKYILLFIDDFSRTIFVYFISSKTEVRDKFCHFQSLVERQTGAKIKTIRTDNGTEFVNSEFSSYLNSCGIQHQTTVPYSPQQNGVAERTNRSVVEKARSLMAEGDLTKAYWEDATRAAVYLKNRCPHRALNNKTPYELWNGQKPDLSNLRVFGCRALIHIPSCHRTKLDAKAEEAIFVGYTDDPNSYLFRIASCIRTLKKSRDVTFFEDCFSSLKHGTVDNTGAFPGVPLIILDNPPIMEGASSTVQEYHEHIPVFTEELPTQEQPAQDCPIAIEDQTAEIEHSVEELEEGVVSDSQPDGRRYPTRNRNPPDYFSYQVSSEEADEPRTFREATLAEDSEKWQMAMADEYNSLMKLKTWKLVDKGNNKVIRCKWVYKLKKDPAGNVVKYKARLVAKGFSQTPGIDYFQTFAPVIRHSSLRTLLALAAELDLKMRHMDVDTAFLNGELQEKVYMEQPQGFKVKGKENQVCLLMKSLYGLKQAPRAWNIKLNETLSSIGFTKTPSEPCVYTKLFGNEMVIVAIFVDDIIVFYNNDKTFDIVKNDLSKYFSLKDLGYLSYYLGLNIIKQNDEIRVHQKNYINDLLRKFGMESCKTSTTPLSGKLEVSTNSDTDQYPYQELIGCLMFLSVNTRPDISYATSYLSQFNTRYDKTHWLAAKRVLQYLKGTIDYQICYKKSGMPLVGYSDADWANCKIDRRSYTGYVFKLAGSPVSWASRKQQTVALSSAEAEYMAITEATKEGIYLKRFISEIICDPVVRQNFIPNSVTINTDSQSAQSLALNPVHHHRTKHIDTRYHFIRQKISDNIVNLEYTKSCDMPADVLTKPLLHNAHRRCILRLGLIV